MTDTSEAAPTADSSPDPERWIQAGIGWGARAAEWAYLFEPYALDGRRLRIELPPGSLAFTYCQVPVIYRLGPRRRLVVTEHGGRTVELEGDTLDADRSAALFDRSGQLERIEVETEPGR